MGGDALFGPVSPGGDDPRNTDESIIGISRSVDGECAVI